MRKIKVASLFESIKIGGGVEKIQADLSIGLTEIGYEFIHLVLEDKSPRNEYKGTIISLGEKFIFGFGIKKVISLFRIAWKVKQYCVREKIDILIGQGDFFYMISGLVKLFGFSGKIIGVVMTTIGLQHKLIIYLLRFFLGLHDCIIFLSHEEKQIFIDDYGFKSTNLLVISPSIDVKKVSILGKENVGDILFDKFTFISIGRLTYQKGQDRLIYAFYKFHMKYPDTQLLILGDGELHDIYQNLIESFKSPSFSKNIHLLGNKENVYKYLSKSQCFVLSSHFEGFGLVLIEAMVCNLPVISTNCPTGPSEIIGMLESDNYISYREFGILVDYKTDTIQRLVKAMEIIYTNESLYNSYKVKSGIRGKQYDHSFCFIKWDSIIQSLVD